MKEIKIANYINYIIYFCIFEKIYKGRDRGECVCLDVSVFVEVRM